MELSPSPKPRCALRRGIVLHPALGLWLALHPLPVRAATDKPWAVENPAGAEARFGLGLGFYAERQEGLKITFQRTTTELSIPGQGTVTTVVPGDPALLNRKFDLGWRLQGPVLQMPFALPTLRFGGGRDLYSALVLEVTRAEIDLDIGDRSAPDTTNSRTGNELMGGAWLDLVMPLCRRCPWFAGGGYRQRVLPKFGLDCQPPVDRPGLVVQGETASLAQRSHEAFLRLGYSPASWPVAPYAGVRHGSSTTTVAATLSLVSVATGLVTSTTTRTRFESEATLAMAGVDARLGPRLFGRTEATYGDGDTSLLVKVVYLQGGKGRLGSGTDAGHKSDEDKKKEEEQQRKERARASEIAAEIAPKLALIEEEFVAGWRRLSRVTVLATGAPAYLAIEVADLLDRTEAALLKELDYDELAAMRDWVQERIRQAREALELASTVSVASSHFGGTTEILVSPAVLRSASSVSPTPPVARYALQPPRMAYQHAVDTVLAKLSAACRLLSGQASNEDLVIRLCVRSDPGGANFVISPRRYGEGEKQVNTDNELPVVWRGLYRYRLTKDHYQPLEYDRLDLVEETPTALECTLPREPGSMALPCERRYEQLEECRRDG